MLNLDERHIETQEIQVLRAYGLHLSSVRGKAGECSPVAIFDTLRGLMNFYNSCLANKPWIDDDNNILDHYGRSHFYNKAFKKGSPLEWCNPLDNVDGKLTEENIEKALECSVFGMISSQDIDPDSVYNLCAPFNQPPFIENN